MHQKRQGGEVLTWPTTNLERQHPTATRFSQFAAEVFARALELVRLSTPVRPLLHYPELRARTESIPYVTSGTDRYVPLESLKEALLHRLNHLVVTALKSLAQKLLDRTKVAQRGFAYRYPKDFAIFVGHQIYVLYKIVEVLIVNRWKFKVAARTDSTIPPSKSSTCSSTCEQLA
jgi:hypothetical protein